MTAPRNASCPSMWRDHRPPQDHRCALPAGHAEELHTDRRVWWSDQNSRDTLEPHEPDRSRPVAPPMTAPRMTDEEFEDYVRFGLGAEEDRAEIITEARRARSAESAALARVRRLEEALLRTTVVVASPEGPCWCPASPRPRAWTGHTARCLGLRSALSEET